MSEETKEVATRSGAPVAAVNTKGICIENLDTMWWMANRVISSNLCPKDCKSPEDVLIRMQCGMSAGLNWMQSLQFVSNVNGRPAIWGPPVRGLMMSSGVLKSFTDGFIGDDQSKDDFAAWVEAERKDLPGVHRVEFSVADARRAGLASKDVYKSYLKDMLMYRATGRLANRWFADVLGGLFVAENMRDVIQVEAEVVDQEIEDKPEPPPRSTADLTEATEKLKAANKRASKKSDPKPEPDPRAELLADIAPLQELCPDVEFDALVAECCDGEIMALADMDDTQLTALLNALRKE